MAPQLTREHDFHVATLSSLELEEPWGWSEWSSQNPSFGGRSMRVPTLERVLITTSTTIHE